MPFGLVSRVLRAHGYDHVGAVIDDCIELAAGITKGCIVMSRPFADQYEAHVGQREFLASTRGYEALGRGLRVLDWP